MEPKKAAAGGKRRTLLLNPGSCGPRRLAQPVTLAILTTGPDGWDVKQVRIPRTAREKAPKADGGNIYRQIETVVRDTGKGLPAGAIAEKHGFDRELTEPHSKQRSDIHFFEPRFQTCNYRIDINGSV